MSKPEIRCIQGRYSIWMNDRCIHGGIFTEGEAKSLGVGSCCVQSLQIRYKGGGGMWTSGQVEYEVTE